MVIDRYILFQVSCCEVYTGQDIQSHILPLWTSIRREVVDGVNPQLEAASLSALTAVISSLEAIPHSKSVEDMTDQVVKSAMMGKND